MNESDASCRLPVTSNQIDVAQKPRLLDQVKETIRRKHYSIRTEQSYVDWINRYIYFHDKQHPENLGEQHIVAFLTHLAVKGKVASSTPEPGALCACISLPSCLEYGTWRIQ